MGWEGRAVVLLLLFLFKIQVPCEKVLEGVHLDNCILPTGSPLRVLVWEIRR